MSAVSAVAIPSRWAEAFPFAALEAMSMGKSLIGANAGGLPELIEDGATGLLFRREDPADLAQKFEELRSSPKFLKSSVVKPSVGTGRLTRSSALQRGWRRSTLP